MNWGHTVHTGLGDRDTSTPIRRTIVHYESIVELRRELARVATAESSVRSDPVPSLSSDGIQHVRCPLIRVQLYYIPAGSCITD